MPWQDIVLTLGSLVFVAALLPSVLGANKPALSTSLMTSTVLFVFAGVYITLDLWFTAVVTFATASVWLVLATQQHNRSRVKK